MTKKEIVRLTIGSHELLERSNPPWMLKGFCVGMRGLYELLDGNNPPRMPEGLCVGVQVEPDGLPRGSNPPWMLKRALRGGAGTVRAAGWEQSATDTEMTLRGGIASESKNIRFDGLAKTNARNLKTEADKRIRIQRHMTTMSTLGGMINAVIERGM